MATAPFTPLTTTTPSALLRQGRDPLRVWEPHVGQRAFMGSVLRGECLENYALCSNRWGKSRSGAACGALFARYGMEATRPAMVRGGNSGNVQVYDRATSGWVVSLDYPSSRDVIQPVYFRTENSLEGVEPFIPDHEIQAFHKGDQILRLKNGSILGFKSCESGAEKFQGPGKDFIHFDEVPEYAVFTESTLRVAAGKQLRIFMTATLLPADNPSGQKAADVSWVYEQLVVPWQEGRAAHYRIFQGAIYDNPHLLPSELARLEARYPEGSMERRIRLNGELLPGLQGSMAYPAFEQRLHVRELPPIEYRRPLCLSWDFNVNPLAFVVAQRVSGEFRFHDEFVLAHGNIPDAVEAFRQRYPRHGAEVRIYGDATGGGRSAQTGQSSYNVILREFQGYPVPVRLRVPERNPYQIDRIHAMNMALRDEEGVANVAIAPTCVELIADLRGVLRNSVGGILKVTDGRNPYSQRTHISDAAGYFVAQEAPVSAEPVAPPHTTATGTAQRSIPQIRRGQR